jgi:hypothetical protein
VELSSSESIRALMAPDCKPAPPQRGARFARGPATKNRTRCKCGQCRECLENARWERIFAQKFADPTYYVRRSVRIASPLTSI